MKGKKYFVSIISLVLIFAISLSCSALYYVFDQNYWDIVVQNIAWYKSDQNVSPGKFDSSYHYEEGRGFVIYNDFDVNGDTIPDISSSDLTDLITNPFELSGVSVTNQNGNEVNCYQEFDIPLNILDNGGQDIDLLCSLVIPTDMYRIICNNDVYVWFPRGKDFLEETFFVIVAYDSDNNPTVLEEGTNYYLSDIYEYYNGLYFDYTFGEHYYSALDLNISLDNAKDISYLRVSVLTHSSLIWYPGTTNEVEYASRIHPLQQFLIRDESIKSAPVDSDPAVIEGIEEINKRFDELYEIPDRHQVILDAQKNEIDKVKDDFNDIGNALDSVTTPNQQAIKDNINNIVGDSYDGDLAADVFSPIFANGLVIIMITFVFMFAMMSYILFGKKG